MSKRLPIAKLSPAAARLLLASFEMEPGDTYAELVERSGISNCVTFLSARNQLKELGFIVQRDGQEYTTMYMPDPELTRNTEPYPTIPYPGVVTKVTNAKQ